MIKQLTILGTAFLLSYNLSAQSVSVRETTLDINKQPRKAFEIDFNYDTKIVDGAWQEKAKSLGIKGKSSKGVYSYIGVKVAEVYHETLDLYAAVKKIDKTKTGFLMTASKGYDNFITSTDEAIISNIKIFLTNFSTDVDQYKLKLDIAAHENSIKAAEKEKEKIVNSGKKLEQQAQKNKQAQENKLNEINDLNKRLSEMRSNLK